MFRTKMGSKIVYNKIWYIRAQNLNEAVFNKNKHGEKEW